MSRIVGKLVDQPMQNRQTKDIRSDLKLSREEKKLMGAEERTAYNAYEKAADDLAAEQAKGADADPAKIRGLTAAMNTQEKKYNKLHKARLETAESTLAVQKTHAGSAQGGGGVTTTQMDTTTNTNTTSAFSTPGAAPAA